VVVVALEALVSMLLVGVATFRSGNGGQDTLSGAPAAAAVEPPTVTATSEEISPYDLRIPRMTQLALGEMVFADLGGCASCHTIQGLSTEVIGPELTNIGLVAGTREAGISARDYLTESVRDHETSKNFSENLLESLVEFLLVQR